MAMKNWATAKYEGLGKQGKGYVSTQSGAFEDQPYGFNTRFEGKSGTNPEEQIAAAHASCFTMALAFGLAEGGHSDGSLQTKAIVSLEQNGDDFDIVKSELSLSGHVSGLSRDAFESAAHKAKENCPISKLLKCDISLEITDFDS